MALAYNHLLEASNLPSTLVLIHHLTRVLPQPPDSGSLPMGRDSWLYSFVENAMDHDGVIAASVKQVRDAKEAIGRQGLSINQCIVCKGVAFSEHQNCGSRWECGTIGCGKAICDACAAIAHAIEKSSSRLETMVVANSRVPVLRCPGCGVGITSTNIVSCDAGLACCQSLCDRDERGPTSAPAARSHRCAEIKEGLTQIKDDIWRAFVEGACIALDHPIVMAKFGADQQPFDQADRALLIKGLLSILNRMLMEINLAGDVPLFGLPLGDGGNGPTCIAAMASGTAADATMTDAPLSNSYRGNELSEELLIDHRRRNTLFSASTSNSASENGTSCDGQMDCDQLVIRSTSFYRWATRFPGDDLVYQLDHRNFLDYASYQRLVRSLVNGADINRV